MDTAANDGKRDRITVAEEEHYGHAEETVDGAGDSGKLGPGITVFLKCYRKEEIRFNVCPFELPFTAELQRTLTSGLDFGIGELEKKIDSLPVIQQCLFFIERPLMDECFKKGVGVIRTKDKTLLASVSKSVKKLQTGLLKRLRGTSLPRPPG